VNWKQKETWTRRGKGFSVEVVHWTSDMGDWRGPNHWNVYAYVHSTHPLFAKFNDSWDLWQPATDGIPMHGGCTYLQGHVGPEGEIRTWQAGCDYGHLHDDRFSYMATQDEAAEVFADADRLFAWMENPTDTDGPNIHDNRS
jgi:hypothetical protein